MSSPVADLQKVGEAKLEVVFWDIYFSELFSADGTYKPEQFPVALKITYLRDIDADDLLERTVKEWQKLGFKQQQYNNWVPLLEKMWPDIKDGDELLVHVDESQHSEFFFNGSSIGKIEDSSFGASFLAIWLDENCSYPKVRNKLIGKS